MHTITWPMRTGDQRSYGTIKGRQVFWVSAPVSLLVVFGVSGARATAVYQENSPSRWVPFLVCDDPGGCWVVGYPWDASVYLTYDYSYDRRYEVYNVTLHFEDQSVSYHNVGTDVCNMGGAIRTRVYRDWSSSNLYGTIFVQQPGTYIYPPGTVVFGGLAYPEWIVTDPRVNPEGSVAAAECLGSDSYSWSDNLP